MLTRIHSGHKVRKRIKDIFQQQTHSRNKVLHQNSCFLQTDKRIQSLQTTGTETETKASCSRGTHIPAQFFTSSDAGKIRYRLIGSWPRLAVSGHCREAFAFFDVAFGPGRPAWNSKRKPAVGMRKLGPGHSDIRIAVPCPKTACRNNYIWLQCNFYNATLPSLSLEGVALKIQLKPHLSHSRGRLRRWGSYGNKILGVCPSF